MTNTPAAALSAESEHRSRPPVLLPLFLDFSLSVSKLVVLFTGLLSAGISLAVGAPLLIAGLRGGAAMLAVGLLVWTLNYCLMRNALAAAEEELRKEVEKSNAEAEVKAKKVDEPLSTLEREA